MSDFATLGKIEAIRQLFEGSGYSPFEEPLYIETKDGYSTSVNKLLLEGTDFNLVYFPLKHLGYKSVVCVTGELLAVLSKPTTLSIVLGISAKLDFEQIKEYWSGVITAAKEFGYQKLSLELIPSKNGLSISLSAIGVEDKSERKKAKSKDLICVSGSLGAAFLGQQVLEHKADELEKYKMLVRAYIKPELQANIINSLKDSKISPSYGYFINSGLADALKRLNRDSGFGVKIYADRIPFEGNSFSLGKELNIDPISAAMNGGDDYKLLYIISLEDYERFRTDFQVFDIIGHLAKEEVGTVLVTPDGLEHEISAQAW